MKQEFYTVDQVAKLLNIHPKTIQRYIREGKLRAGKIGKGYRISGQDLSVFTEQEPNSLNKTHHIIAKNVIASSVVDILDIDKDEAMRITNTLTATMNVKPETYGQSSMQTQYIERERTVRVTLWGNVAFMAAMMDTLTALTSPEDSN